ncbi:MAG TPA: SUMF1/EgtB/PvdO family nonheme iron enzyme [Chthonomonadaceae bacterium]|nr:SUMF1/EgtB/PvdO family nonheme iron enzyme [Chthonomonadaceae bacterium]
MQYAIRSQLSRHWTLGSIAALCLIAAGGHPLRAQQSDRHDTAQVQSQPASVKRAKSPLPVADDKARRLAAGPVADQIARSVRADSYAPPPKELLVDFLAGVHTGPADRAVVGVEVVNKTKSGEAERRHFDGLLIRCDGFVLVPLRLVSRGMSGGREAETQTIQVTLNPGTPDAKRVPADLNRFTSTRVAMAVIRLKYTHAPAARTLLPDTLKPGDGIEVVWSEWDDETARFASVRQRTVHVAEPPKDAVQAKAQDIRAGEIRLDESLAGVPPGAAVVGPEGMALGILPDSAARHDRFISMAVLAGVTGCVVPVPTTDEEFARLQKAAGHESDPQDQGLAQAFAPLGQSKDQSPAAAQDDRSKILSPKSKIANDMVTVPGGPVKLPLGILTDYHEMAREMVACVPEFKIDRYKVSNREYYAFWSALPEKERKKPEVIAAFYPVSWATTDPPFPAEIDDTPVLGVPIAGAEAYARAQGKRLPTAYEWCRAAFGPLGDRVPPEWVTRYIQDRQETWRRLVLDHYAQVEPILERDAQLRQAAEIDQKFSRRPVPITEGMSIYDPLFPYFSIPILALNDRRADLSKWSANRVNAEVDRLCAAWIDPLYVLPGGSRPFDVSPFGVCDMLLNGNERVAAYAEMATPQEFISPTFIPGITNPLLLFDLPDARLRSQFGGLRPAGPGLVREDFRVVRDDLFENPLLSRRLVASSARVVSNTRMFCPAQNEEFVELAEHLLETREMICPVCDLRIGTMSNDTIDSGNFSAGTITHKVSPLTKGSEWLEAGAANSGWPLAYSDVLNDTNPGYIEAPGIHYIMRIYTHERTEPRVDQVIGAFNGRYFYETPYYAFWSGPPKHMHREMGREWARDSNDFVGYAMLGIGSSTQPPDIFLIPNGFRCAR